ncbi:hypothetical protein CMEL01_13618 [Colletotrichum melonis]|uniref:F-box domain-containing protein n=1 Tax=Colletotrichum melonis TaxID=1209925 RepID=A0AAI9UUZ6_9PEZI|nr:hypothetical protein CMEL01_13618 [Colletotrichum melonis]
MGQCWEFLITGLSSLCVSIFNLLPPYRQSPTQNGDSITLYQKACKACKACISGKIYTGYDPKSTKRHAGINAKEFLIYQIPLKIQLLVMERLDPVDIFCLRQSCSMFFSAFEHACFSSLQKPVELPENHSTFETELSRPFHIASDHQYSVNHLRHGQKELKGCGDSQSGLRPIVEMYLNNLSARLLETNERSHTD